MQRAERELSARIPLVCGLTEVDSGDHLIALNTNCVEVHDAQHELGTWVPTQGKGVKLL